MTDYSVRIFKIPCVFSFKVGVRKIYARPERNTHANFLSGKERIFYWFGANESTQCFWLFDSLICYKCDFWLLKLKIKHFY